MRQNIRMAFLIRLTMIVSVPGIYLLINNSLEISSATPATDDEIRESINMNTNTNTRRRQQHESPSSSSSSRHLLAIIDEPLRTSEATTATRPAIFNFPTDSIDFKGNKTVRLALLSLIACYIFWMLAIICDEFFVPSIQILCQKMNLSGDAASGAFVSMATSCPELLINCISTFVSGGDIGVGTIVGSAACNMLVIPALCGLFTCASIQLDWWTISRDCSFYFVAVIALIAVINDSQIMWYEAAFLVLCYVVYLIAMSKNDKMSEKAKSLAHVIRRKFYRQRYRDVTEISPLFIRGKSFDYKACQPQPQQQENFEKIELSEPQLRMDDASIQENESHESDDSAAINPCKNFHSKRAIYWLRLPIDLFVRATMPDPKRHKELFMLTFIICVIWIGICSYLIVYVTTDVDSVMGMTFLALGTSIPEAMSSIILTSHGFGPLTVSNSIQSNIFDILLCLGFPWLVRSLVAPAISVQPTMMFMLKTTDTKFYTISLTMTLFALYISFMANKFVLDKKIGVCCAIFYLLFLVFASFVDFNVFFPLKSTRISDY